VAHDPPRYDRHADWYEGSLRGSAAGHTERVQAVLAELLGAGAGRCLDVGCGTGFHAGLLAGLGWVPVGVDLSGAQLRHARNRLPVAAGALDAVAATHIHTDVEDWAAVCREVARVLAPGGRFVYVGAHPCFSGAFADRLPDGRVHVYPGYLHTGLRFDGPGLRSDGIRARAGYVQRTLEALLTPLLASGLRLTVVREDADAPTPDLLGLRAERA